MGTKLCVKTLRFAVKREETAKIHMCFYYNNVNFGLCIKWHTSKIYF